MITAAYAVAFIFGSVVLALGILGLDEILDRWQACRFRARVERELLGKPGQSGREC